MPAVSGQFYPGTASGLSRALLALTREVEAPESAIGVVAPHAGYVYSGAVAGEVFSSVRVPGTAVIFCPNHTGIGEDAAIMSHGAWRMPWGDVPIDEDLAARLETACPLLREDASAHSREHAIEVQLPFLHRFRPDVRIVPVALGRLSLEECREIGEDVADAIAGDAERPLLVASSDMSHYVPDAVARKKDQMAIDRMLALDPEGLYRDRPDRADLDVRGAAGHGGPLRRPPSWRDLGPSDKIRHFRRRQPGFRPGGRLRGARLPLRRPFPSPPPGTDPPNRGPFMPNVVTRFAPSPTGYLHIGGARTALFNRLYARHNGGKFILRIEDTDQERSTPEAVQAILDGMTWLGITWDEGPHFQMERMDLYRKEAERLLREGKAYRCVCTKEELDARREEMAARKEKPRYDGRCRDLAPEATEGKPSVLRFKTPRTGQTVVHDLLRGDVVYENAELDDLVLLRTDGSPTYNFVVVIDDASMGITHVLRGDDHLNNTPKQVLLYEALGYPLPAVRPLSADPRDGRREAVEAAGRRLRDGIPGEGVSPRGDGQLPRPSRLGAWRPGDLLRGGDDPALLAGARRPLAVQVQPG